MKNNVKQQGNNSYETSTVWSDTTKLCLNNNLRPLCVYLYAVS